MFKTRAITGALSEFFRDIVNMHFTGSGLDDATFGGTYTGYKPLTYLVRIAATGTPDQYQYSIDSGANWSTAANITAGPDALSNGVTVTFSATTGHTLYDTWVVSAFCIAQSYIETSETFTGSGLNDLTPSGTYKGFSDAEVRIKISTAAGTDKFKYSFDKGLTYSAEVSITTNAQHIGRGVIVTFAASTGHTADEYWDFICVAPHAYVEIHDIHAHIETAEASDEIILGDEDGNDIFANISIAAAGNVPQRNFTGQSVMLKPGKDVGITTTGSSFKVPLTINATIHDI